MKMERNNDRFSTFVLNSSAANHLASIFEYGLFIARRGYIDETARQICVPLRYGNNTYRFDLTNFSTDEYIAYEKWFDSVIEPFMITKSAVVIYFDDDVVIYVGDLVTESKERKEEASYGRRTESFY